MDKNVVIKLHERLAIRILQWVTHIVVLLLSVALIAMISIDTFNSVDFYENPTFQKWQFWICIVFIAEFLIEFILAERKWHYLWTHIIFLLVSIPYQAVVEYFGIHLAKEVAYLIRYMPLIRGGYAMAYVISWFTSNKATGMFFAYIITMMSTVYFCSLTFYLFEHHVNSGVTKYLDSLWWACMAVTTEGSSIEAVTGVGRALSVLLAGMGIIMFPVFTVYVTDIINRKQQETTAHDQMVKAYHNLLMQQQNKEPAKTADSSNSSNSAVSGGNSSPGNGPDVSSPSH